MTQNQHGTPQDASPRAEDDDGIIGGIPGGPGIVAGVGEVGNTAEDLNAALAEARLLSEAVLGHQNRSTGINEGDAESEENRFPCFFIVSGSGTVEVRAAPSTTSPFVRTLAKVRIKEESKKMAKVVQKIE